MPNHAAKILFVDDHPANILALHASLRDCGYTLIDASSGYEAVEHAREHDFAAILLDVQMPGLDGFETAKLLRQQKRSKTTPIIFVTANHLTEGHVSKGYGAGAVDYLFKPINVEILKAKLAVFVEMQRQALLLKETAVRDRENELLKEALKIRDDFLSMAAHELKTPITPLNLQMQAFLSMLNEGTFGRIEPERLRRMLETSNEQVQRLNKFIDELLDVTRISAGRLDLKREKFDLGELVHSVVRSFEAPLRAAGCDVRLDLDSGIVGQWDRFRLEQAVSNLLSNALKYGARHPIEVAVKNGGKMARVKVKDNGIGIHPEDQGRIFERFERSTSSQHNSGLGLGLYIANQVVLRHGGTIRVASRPGDGAEFVLNLPLD
ncbi:MAG TPA: hybrid sensor histidine kinase/response regulator [Bdellovibrionales bacterium]|nr:hybrid sensor histidine kinase/response regulator [Bdellovibrionales bacterium]